MSLNVGDIVQINRTCNLFHKSIGTVIKINNDNTATVYLGEDGNRPFFKEHLINLSPYRGVGYEFGDWVRIVKSEREVSQRHEGKGGRIIELPDLEEIEPLFKVDIGLPYLLHLRPEEIKYPSSNQKKKEYIVVAEKDCAFDTREEAIKTAINLTKWSGDKHCVFELIGTTVTKAVFEEI